MAFLSLLRRLAGWAVPVAAALVACGSDDGAQPAKTAARLCTPGSYVFCRCADNRSGTRLCRDDAQSFDPCACEGDPPGDGGSGGEGGAQGSCPGKTIDLSPGESMLVSGTTAGAFDQITAACAGTTGPEVVYRVRPLVTGSMAVKVKGELPLDPVIYASKGGCGASSSPCINASGAGELEGFSLPVQVGEDIFVGVDSAGPGGAFAMTLSLQPTAENDTCPGASVSVVVGGDVTLSGTTTYAKGDLVGSGPCGGDAPDLVYAVTAGEAGVLTAQLSPEASYDGQLYARSGACADGTQAACADQGGAGAAEQLTTPVKAGEPLFLIVDGKKGSAGKFTLSLHLDLASAAKCGNGVAEPGEQCDDGNDAVDDGCNPGCLVEHDPSFADCPGLPLHLFDAAELISGSTTSYGNFDAGSCGGDKASDRFYNVVPHKDGSLQVKVVNASFDLVLYARGGNCPTGAELACADVAGKGGEALTLPVKAGQPLWLAVDGHEGQSGTFTLSFQVE